jgi:capsular polysaccharide transport system permease protein
MKLSYRSILFILIVLLPFGLFTFYELAIATSRYHSASAIAITEDEKVVPTLDLSSIGLQGSVGSQDALTLVTFMNSPDMKDYLEQTLGLRKHFSSEDADWWTRLPKRASKEDFYDYVDGMVTVELDPISQLVQIHAQAFTRQFAQSIVNALLARSQEFVDRLNSSITREKIQFFEKQLIASEERLRQAKSELLAFQRDNKLLTAETEAQLVNTTIAALNSQLIAKEGQLEVSLRELNERSPVVKRTKTEIDTLKRQIIAEKDRLSIGSDGSPVSEIAAQFAEIQANMTFLEV